VIELECSKGKLVAIGGGEDKNDRLEILSRLLDEAKGIESVIEVITTASRVPHELERIYEDAFKKLYVRNVHAINISSNKEANREYNIKRLKGADIIFFTGGDQLRLTSILGGSEFLEAIKTAYKNGAVIAGTSAGAAALSDVMIYRGESRLGLIKSNVCTTEGFNFIKNVVFDTHFINRGRFLRLFQVVATNPKYVGIGLSEDTSVFFKDEYNFEVIGSGSVIVVDGSHIKNTNISKINNGDLIAIENFHVHTLINGYKYNLKTKTPTPPSI